MAPATSLTAPSGLGHRPALDGLRAISVVAVVLYHAEVSWMPGGFLGVEVFFVVSGFLITTLLLEERGRIGGIDVRQFWIRRARRLLPALYLLLAVVSVAGVLVYADASGRLGGDVLAALAYVSNWWQIFLNESYFAQTGRPPLLLHLWSLAVEEQFYIFFPPLFALGMVTVGRAVTRNVVAALAVASTLWMAHLYEPFTDTSRIYYGTDTRASGLLLGVLLAMVWTPWASRRRAAPAAGPTLDAVGVVALLVIGWFFVRVNAFDSFIYLGGFFLLDLACIVLIAVLVHPSARLSHVLAWAPLVWVGVRSYSLYLWHWPIFQLTRPGLDVPLDGATLFVLRLALTLIAAELSFRYVETPLRDGALGRWWADLRSSDGSRRAAMARQGWVLGGACIVVVSLLGVGLFAASTSPDRERLELAALGEDPDLAAAALSVVEDADPSAPVTTASTTTTTTSAPTTTAPPSSEASTSAVPAPPATAPPATAPPAGAGSLAVGDSVMVGAQRAFAEVLPGMRVDAKVGRQFDNVLDVVAWYMAEGLVTGDLVVHAGSNGIFSDADLDRLVGAAGDRRVLLVNAHVSRQWQDLVNGRLAAAAERHPNAVLVDWHALGTAHPEWFASDGAHVGREGAVAFAQLIRDRL